MARTPFPIVLSKEDGEDAVAAVATAFHKVSADNTGRLMLLAGGTALLATKYLLETPALAEDVRGALLLCLVTSVVATAFIALYRMALEGHLRAFLDETALARASIAAGEHDRDEMPLARQAGAAGALRDRWGTLLDWLRYGAFSFWAVAGVALVVAAVRA